jgi:hypothetical protein
MLRVWNDLGELTFEYFIYLSECLYLQLFYKFMQFIAFGQFYENQTVNKNSSRVIMRTITVEIKNEMALTLLHNLESMNILRVIENKTLPDKQKLSERFAGCLSEERTEELQKELTQMRNEWERGTY